MKWMVVTVVFAVVLETIVAPPVIEKKEEEKKEEEKDKNARFEEMGIEYNRYLVQVVEALESDPEFRKKLENATSDDIQTGNIAHELDFVAHNVRTKLDELKRIELERLRKLARQEFELENDIDTTHMKIEPGHVDHTNPHTFEIADLKKLIAKTSEDLAEADKKRRDEFKSYEMEKEFEKQQKLKELDEDKRKKYLEELEQQKLKHKQHDPLHHPGSKQQLEEVWEKQDHMENQEFDPKAFFFMHDLDGNGVWDEAEVKALFLKELDKLYQAGAPEDDMRERAEEMERMREHVFREADLNHDNLISFQEFLAQTKKPEFERDPGWEPLDEQQIYTQDEYLEFERRRQQEIERLVREGKLQPPPVYHQPPPPNYYPQGQVYHPNQVPYQQQAQAYQQQQLHQQQQHFQQQQQNTYQQQQQYQQQNPPHYQQQQFQQPINNQQQQQQPVMNNQQQQPIINSQQQSNPNNMQQQQQVPISNNIPQQPIGNIPQQPIGNNIPQQPIGNNIPQQPIGNNIPQQPIGNNIPQQPIGNSIPQQPTGNNIPQQPIGNNIPQQPMGNNNIPQQPIGNNIPQQPMGNNNIPQQPLGNNIPVQGNAQVNVAQPNAVNSNEIPKYSGPVHNSIPHGPK